MIALSPEAEDHVDRLIAHHETNARLEAAENPLQALERASARIGAAPEAGLKAPRPYPALARTGRRWIIEGHYWIAYSVTNPPIIVAVFYVTSDIPGRS